MFWHKDPYLELQDINKIEVELSNRCNASCPSCSRTDIDGKALKALPLNDISLEQFKKNLTNEIISGKNIKLCGVFGDPIMAPDILEITDYICKSNGRVTINTNGSLRNQNFWTDLAKILRSNKTSHEGVIFSIDGLEDTNHIYRRNTSWKKIMENVQAYIAAGGPAIWDYIVFSHNEHQVEKAEKLAKKMGFKRFTIKRTTRASSDKKPTPTEEALNIKPSQEYLHQSLRQPSRFKKSNFFFSPLLNKAKQRDIECFSRGESSFQIKKDRSFYISANLRLWPCCWYADAEFPQKKEVRELYKKYGQDFNSLHTFSISQILSSKWYKKDLVQAWHQSGSKVPICFKNCNKNRPLNNEDCQDVKFV